MTVDPRSPESSHQASATPPQTPLSRHSGRLSGLAYQVEQCPDGSPRDHGIAAVGGAGLGFVASLFFGASLGGKLLGAALGATAGTLLSRWHMRLDWDPDAMRSTLKAVPFLGSGSSNRQAV